MRRRAGFIGLGLGLLLAAWGQAAPAADGGTWVLYGRAGEPLAGELLGLGAQVRWRRLDGAEQALPTATVRRLCRRDPGAPAGGQSLLRLRAGDRLACTAVTLNAGAVTAELVSGARLVLAKSAVTALDLDAGGSPDPVSGLGQLEDWLGGVQGWEAVASGFRARSWPALLGRRELLPERFGVTLALAGEPTPEVWLHLCTEAMALPTGEGYVLHLAEATLALERHDAHGAARPVGSCRLPAGTGDRLELTLAVDLPQRRFRLAVAGRPAAEWTDAGSPPPAARGLLLVALSGPVTVSDLRVTGSDAGLGEEAAASPTGEDHVTLANGDAVDGDVLAIAADGWELRRRGRPAPLRLVGGAIRGAWFGGSAGPSVQPSGHEVRLRDGSLLWAADVSLAGGLLRLRAPAWGDLELPQAALEAIAFADPVRPPARAAGTPAGPPGR